MIPARFVHRVVRHAVAVAALPGYPLMLAVQGPPGSGKSFGVHHSLERARFHVIRRSAVTLSGEFEGEPIEALKRIYREADTAARQHGVLPTIVLEDFDLSPAGEREDTRYTVNSQLLAGFLMHLADDVAMCEVGTDARYPLYLTGNDFTVLPGPLVRPGRVDFFTWEPSEDERIAVVVNLVDGLVPPDVARHAVPELVRRHGDLPLSAFVAARNHCLADVAYLAAAEVGTVPDIHRVREHVKARGVSIEELDRALHALTQGPERPRAF